MNSERVILIGLDGATWSVIDQFIDTNKNELSCFNFLRENGFTKNLISTTPPLSPAAWTSIFTGLKPIDHNIWSFVKEKKGSYSIRPISSLDIKGVPLWDKLSKKGLRGIFLNIPFFYPPNKFNGILTTGLGTPSINSNFSYPSYVREEILSKFPTYNIDFNEDKILRSNNKDFIIDNIYQITEAHIDTFKYFFEKEYDQCNVFSVVLRSLDVIQHYFWDNNEILFKFYKQADNFLQWCINNKNENDTLIVCSDHGFRGINKRIYVNQILREHGYLKKQQSSASKKNKFLPSLEYFHLLLTRMGLRKLTWKLKKSKFLPLLANLFPSKTLSYEKEIDWKNTSAYFLQGSYGIININLKNRQPDGNVTKDNFNKIRKNIINHLKNIEDYETGLKIFEFVSAGEEIYGSSENTPDIIIYPNDGYCLKGGFSETNKIIENETKRNGDHSLDGVFIAYGSKIKNLNKKGKLYVWDILTVILDNLNIDVSNKNGYEFGNKFKK